MIGFFRGISEKLSNRMLAPGAEESDYYEDDYYEDDDRYEEEPEVQVRYTQRQPVRKTKTSSSARSSNVYGFTASSGASVNVHKHSESYIMHPKTMEDAVEIGSHVRSGRMCIVNLTGVQNPEAQRIADYLCGISDALDGSIQRVNNTIITVSPPNHRVMQDYREESPFDAGFFSKASSDR
jgi:cell division inhibitor SepF